MKISEALVEIFERLYTSRLELVDVMEKKGIKYPSDLTRIDEWGTVRIVSQYLGMELDEYTVEEVEHLKRRKGRLLTGGNVTSFRDSIQIARQMVPSITNHFDINDKSVKSFIFDIPENTKMYWAVAQLSNVSTISIGIGVINNKDIIYTITGGMSWNYYDLGLSSENIISIQPKYSYYLQMVLFLIRTNNHIYLYGASIGEKGLRIANNMDKYGFLDKFHVKPLPDSSVLKMCNIKKNGEENFIIFMNATVDDETNPKLRIINMSTSSLQNTIVDNRDDPVLTNGYSFTEEEWPITPYGNHFFVVNRFCDTHYDNMEQKNQMMYEYLILHRDKSLFIYDISIDDDNRDVVFNFIKKYDAPFITDTCNLTYDIERGRTLNGILGKEKLKDDIISLKLSDGTKKFIYRFNNTDEKEITTDARAFITYNGIAYPENNTLIQYTDTESVSVSVDNISNDKIFPCYSDEEETFALIKLLDEKKYTMYSIDQNGWSSSNVFSDSLIRNPYTDINIPCYTKIVNGIDGIQMMARIYRVSSSSYHINNLFISYDNGETWYASLQSFPIIGIWYFHGIWYICNQIGEVHYCTDTTIGKWIHGCTIDIPSIGMTDYFANIDVIHSIDVYRIGKTIRLQTFTHDSPDSIVPDNYGIEITIDVLKQNDVVINLETMLDRVPLFSTIDNDNYRHDIIWDSTAQTWIIASTSPLDKNGDCSYEEHQCELTSFYVVEGGLVIYPSKEFFYGSEIFIYNKIEKKSFYDSSVYTVVEDIIHGGNSSHIIDPIDGVTKKYPNRILSYGSMIEVNQIDTEYANLANGEIMSIMYEMNGNPYIQIGSTAYAAENSSSILLEEGYNHIGEANAFGCLTYDSENKQLVMSTTSGYISTYKIDLPDNVRIRNINGYFALIDGTNKIKFLNWYKEDIEPSIIEPDPIGSNLQIVDCVYYDDTIWYLLIITIKGVQRAFIHPISIKDSFLGIWGEMKYERIVFPNTEEIVGVGAIDENIIPSIYRGYNYLIILTNGLYTYDGWHFKNIKIPNEINISDFNEIHYQEPTVYFYTDKCNLIGYMNDNENFVRYRKMDSFVNNAISKAMGRNIYTLAPAPDGSSVVYRDGLTEPTILQRLYGNNGDVIITQCRNNEIYPDINIKDVLSLVLYYNSDNIGICLDTPSYTVNIGSEETCENAIDIKINTTI